MLYRLITGKDKWTLHSTWSCRLQCYFLLELPEQPIINDMHKTNPQFWDKYDIRSFEHTTFLTQALHNVYQHKQNKTVYLFTRICIWPNNGTIIHIQPNTINLYSVQPGIHDALKEGLLIWRLQLFLAIWIWITVPLFGQIRINKYTVLLMLTNIMQCWRQKCCMLEWFNIIFVSKLGVCGAIWP